MKSYTSALQIAELLPYRAHWMLGVGFCFIGLLVENMEATLQTPALPVLLYCMLGGLPLSLLSRVLLFLCPWSYAWLTRQLMRLGFAF
jgi:hypothetical protein